MRNGQPLPRRRWVGLGVAVVVLGLLGWLVVGLGALGERDDSVIESALGEEIDAGNLVFTFDSATLQRIETTYGDPGWEVRVSGTVRNPHENTLAPMDGDLGNFLASVDGTTMLLPADVSPFEIGGALRRQYVLPDDQTRPFVVRFEPEASFVPGEDPSMVLGVVPMEFTDNTVYGLGFGAGTWNKDSAAAVYGLRVPLEVLPPATR